MKNTFQLLPFIYGNSASVTVNIFLIKELLAQEVWGSHSRFMICYFSFDLNAIISTYMWMIIKNNPVYIYVCYTLANMFIRQYKDN